MQAQAVELLSELVAIESVNPSLVLGGAGEGEIAAFVTSWSRAAGLDAQVLEETPGRPSVVCVRAGQAEGARCSCAATSTPSPPRG